MLEIVVDSRVRIVGEIPEAAAVELRGEFEDTNPQIELLRRLGYSTRGVERVIRAWREEGNGLTFPRGGMQVVREVLRRHGVAFREVDRRHPGDPCPWFPEYVGFPMRPHQEEGIEAAMRVQNCVLRAPTGSGKTALALALAARIKLNTLVIVSTRGLFNQWIDRTKKSFGLYAEEVGVIQGKTRRLQPVTIAIQKTLADILRRGKKGNLSELFEFFGCVIADEVQLFGAKTFYDVIDPWPAKYRIGISADERRKDRKEFLIYRQFGDVAHEVSREEVRAAGHILDVEIRVVPTDFRADWYGMAQEDREDLEIDFQRLLEEMTSNDARNELIARHALAELAGGQVIVLSHRVKHCQDIDRALVAAGVRSGYLIGGPAYRREFESTVEGIASGRVRAGVGTYLALGYGIDLPAVAAGVAATPIAANRQVFNQVRGRVCRVAPGKEKGVLVYLWDQHVFPRHLKNIVSWNPTVKVLSGGKWVDAGHYLGRKRRTTR